MLHLTLIIVVNSSVTYNLVEAGHHLTIITKIIPLAIEFSFTLGHITIIFGKVICVLTNICKAMLHLTLIIVVNMPAIIQISKTS